LRKVNVEEYPALAYPGRRELPELCQSVYRDLVEVQEARGLLNCHGIHWGSRSSRALLEKFVRNDEAKRRGTAKRSAITG
jgi:hypothetical protein